MNSPAGIVGVDLDNTVVCYDLAFHRAALDRGLIDPGIPASKTQVKQAVLRNAGDQAWTELQGFVYGPGIGAATLYPGVLDFFRTCVARGFRPLIISHKTRFAAAGPRHDLREAATRWLKQNALLDLLDSAVVFTDTRAAKIDAVRENACRTLIDDLPEVYREPGFPASTGFILFDPDGAHTDWALTPRASAWPEITARLFP